MERGAALLGLARPATMPAMEEDGGEGEEEASGPRAELARHLREEAADWLRNRSWIHEQFFRKFPDAVEMPWRCRGRAMCWIPRRLSLWSGCPAPPSACGCSRPRPSSSLRSRGGSALTYHRSGLGCFCSRSEVRGRCE